MSWLLAASIPPLLMLATSGLQRLESVITVETDDDVDQLLAHAVAAAPSTPRPAPVRVPNRPFGYAPSLLNRSLSEEPRLPTRFAPR